MPGCQPVFDLTSQRFHQLAVVVLNVAEHFRERVAFDHCADLDSAVVDIDVNRVRITKQVVKVSQNFLIRTNQKDRKLIRLVLSKRMQAERLCYVQTGR